MRCDNCNYCRYDHADNMYVCEFGFDDKENSKGQSGCRYNRKTLNKKYKEKMDEIYKEESEGYIDYCTSLFNGS